MNLRHLAPKASALPTALHPDRYYIKLLYAYKSFKNSPLRFPQKHSRTARLERFALLLVSSPQSLAFICHWQRLVLRPTALHPDDIKLNFIHILNYASTNSFNCELRIVFYQLSTLNYTITTKKSQPKQIKRM